MASAESILEREAPNGPGPANGTHGGPDAADALSRSTQLNRGRVRLRTLTTLRWMAVGGQSAALLIVYVILGFHLPILPCLAVIAASVAINLYATWRGRNVKWLSDRQARYYLAFDLVQLFALLYLTGGIGNPFALFFLAPVTISASTLGLRSTLMLGGLSFACLTVLSLAHQPLPWVTGRELTLPDIYVTGIWVALVIGLLFTSLYAWRISRETERMRQAMDATSQVLAREQRLAALGALAAAAAHELGTPLATIQLVSRELERDMGADTPYSEDLVLLRSQAERCREILSRLSERPGQGDAVHERAGLGALLEEVVAPHRDFGVSISVHLHNASDAPAKEPVIWRRPEILYGLRNLVENAVDFARARVAVDASWSLDGVMVRISDDGPGFAPEVIGKLGEPYVTTRPAWRDRENMDETDPSPHGMGLGFFIAKTLLEQSGARISFRNLAEGAEPGARGGAAVTVSWARSAVAVP